MSHFRKTAVLQGVVVVGIVEQEVKQAGRVQNHQIETGERGGR